MWGSASGMLSTVQYHRSPLGQGTSPAVASVRRLRHGAVQHEKYGVSNSVQGVPTVLQTNAYYVPAVEGATLLHVQLHTAVRVFLLIPASQVSSAPAGLQEGAWELVKGSEVKMRWGGFSLKQRALLNIINQHRAYQEQPLLLYSYTTNAGILQAGQQLVLPLEQDLNNSTWPASLSFQPILCMRTTTTLNVNPGESVTGVNLKGGSSLQGQHLQHQGSVLTAHSNPATWSLQLIYSGLEDGTFDVVQLRQEQADMIMQRAMAAANDELLLMLVDANAVLYCSPPAIWQLLEYAQAKDLLYMADIVLRKTQVELTQPLLIWLVGAAVTAKKLYEAEHLLASYVLARRNPLNTVAAIEHALIKAATSGFVENLEAMQLAMRFRAAKHALLQQLIQQYADNQQATAIAGGSPRRDDADYADEPLASAPPPLLLNPLLHAVKLCLQELSSQAVGRGGGAGRVSIHDISPYSMAISLSDAVFLSSPPVMDYTRLIWNGLEPHRMRRVAYQVDSVAEATAAILSSNSMCCAAASVKAAMDGVALVQQQPGMIRTASPAVTQRNQQQLRNGASSIGCAPRPCAEVVEGSNGSCLVSQENTTSTGDSFSASVDVASQVSGQKDATGSAWQAVHAAAVFKRSTRASRRTITSKSVHTFGSGKIGVQGLSTASGASSCWITSTVGFEMMQNLGLAGNSFGAVFARYSAILMHGLLLAPRALHDSSRGRWIKRMVFELFFLVVFQATVMGSPQTILLATFPALLLGNLVDIGFQLQYKYGGNFVLYVKDHWAKLDLVVNVGLLGVVIWDYWHLITGTGTEKEDTYNLRKHNVRLEYVVASAFAVLVWSRALGLLNPLSSKLGAMLYTLRRAAEEAAVMVPVLLVLMLGFGTTLTVVYSTTMGRYDTLAGALRTLIGITGGDLRITDFETAAAATNPFLMVFGQVVIIIYIIVVNILIMTLLIAIINHTYHPEAVKAQAVVMQAESVFHYDWHVRLALPCSPVNILQLAACWLPKGYRARQLSAACLKYWIPPLDGYVPESIAAAPQMLLTTGPSEIGYLAFLFLMYPLIAATGLLLLILHVPFGVSHFVLKGHRLWLDAPGSSRDVSRRSGDDPYRSQDGSSCGAVFGQSKALSVNAGVQTRRPVPSTATLPFQESVRESLQHNKSVEVATGASGMQSAMFVGGRMIMPSSAARALARPASRHSIAELTASLIVQLLLQVVRLLLLAAVALAAHVVLLILLVLVLLWAFLTRVVFSMYCIFASGAADSNVCQKLSRAADFWGKADVLAAFQAASIFVISSYGDSTGLICAGDASCSVAMQKNTAAGGLTARSTSCKPCVHGNSVAISRSPIDFFAVSKAPNNSSSRLHLFEKQSDVSTSAAASAAASSLQSMGTPQALPVHSAIHDWNCSSSGRDSMNGVLVLSTTGTASQLPVGAPAAAIVSNTGILDGPGGRQVPEGAADTLRAQFIPGTVTIPGSLSGAHSTAPEVVGSPASPGSAGYRALQQQLFVNRSKWADVAGIGSATEVVAGGGEMQTRPRNDAALN